MEEIAANLVAWFMLDDAERERARLALAEAARRYSWENAAKGVIAAAQGRLRPANQFPAVESSKFKITQSRVKFPVPSSKIPCSG